MAEQTDLHMGCHEQIKTAYLDWLSSKPADDGADNLHASWCGRLVPLVDYQAQLVDDSAELVEGSAKGHSIEVIESCLACLFNRTVAIIPVSCSQ